MASLVAVLEAYRRYKSLETWGRMLQWDGWPKEWPSSHENAKGDFNLKPMRPKSLWSSPLLAMGRYLSNGVAAMEHQPLIAILAQVLVGEASMFLPDP